MVICDDVTKSFGFAILLYLFCFLTTGFEYVLSFNHLMRWYIYIHIYIYMYVQRERDTHICQMLWSVFLSEWSLQVWGGQYCPGQYCPAPASTDTALGTFGTCSKRKQWLQRSDIWRVTQVTSCSRDSPQHRGGGKREREREILLLLLQMFSSRGDSSRSRIKKLELLRSVLLTQNILFTVSTWVHFMIWHHQEKGSQVL